MREIPLTQGKMMIVDAEDYEFMRQWKWCVNYKYAGRRAGSARRPGSKIIYAHRVLAKAGPGDYVDHKNGNTFDNRKSNLRVCTQSQNCCNRGPAKNNISGVKGVNWNKKTQKWRARVKFGAKEIPLGCFSNLEDAKQARRMGALIHHGEFAKEGQ